MKKADAIYILHENLARKNLAFESLGYMTIPIYNASSRNGIGSNVNVSVARNNVIKHAKSMGYKCIWMLDDSIQLANTRKIYYEDSELGIVKEFRPSESFVCHLDKLTFKDSTVIGNLPLHSQSILRDDNRFNRFVYCAYFIDVTKTLMFDEVVWYAEDVDFSIRSMRKFGPIETNYNACIKTLDRNSKEYANTSGTICSANFEAKCKAYYEMFVKYPNDCTIRFHTTLGYFQVLPKRLNAANDLVKYIDYTSFDSFLKSCQTAVTKGRIEVVK